MGFPRRQPLGPLTGATPRPGLLHGVRRPEEAQGHPVDSWQPAGPQPAPQAPTGLQTQHRRGGPEGELGPDQSLLRAQRDRSLRLNSPRLPCARLQPPSRPADEEELVPAPTNTRRFCGEAVPGSLTEWVDLKAQSAVTGWGRARPVFPLKHGGGQAHTGPR